MDKTFLDSSVESPRTPESYSSQDEFFSVTSNISPSSQRTTSRIDKEIGEQSSPASEAQVFLSDLNNYLPLGCLGFEDWTELTGDEITGEWHETAHFPLILGFQQVLGSHLHRLANAGWIRIFSARSTANPRYLVFRVYILPQDVGHRFVDDRESKRLCNALQDLVAELDVSEDAWRGHYTPKKASQFDMWATRDDGSLFWMFNKLPSPLPTASKINEKYAREALEDLLDPESLIPGLKTQLYPYQRRSAGLMLQRESTSTIELDPRFERRTAPDGSDFYFSARDLKFYRDPPYQEACRGGVLAETMGLGKTVMCLALILATKDHYPRIPLQQDKPPARNGTASLADMAISAINRKSIPWRVEFQRIQHASGDYMSSCRARLENALPSYKIEFEPERWNRNTVLPPPKTMNLASTTLIVVSAPVIYSLLLFYISSRCSCCS